MAKKKKKKNTSTYHKIQAWLKKHKGYEYNVPAENMVKILLGTKILFESDLKPGAKVLEIAWERIKPGVVPKKKQYKTKPKSFYLSGAWRAIRWEALELYGRKCQSCGNTPPHTILHVDHIKPISRYPELKLDINNLQILCEDCNLGKSDTSETDCRVLN